MTANDSRSVSELFGDALSQFSKLVRNELQLARAEISMIRTYSGAREQSKRAEDCVQGGRPSPQFEGTNGVRKN